MTEQDGITEIKLDYPIYPQPRYGYANRVHGTIEEILKASAWSFKQRLESFLSLVPMLLGIKPTRELAGGELEPVWSNGFLPGLDTVALYGILAQEHPALYLEIGSGNSTKVARRAIAEHGLKTRIVSIDPFPRAEVDELCDEIIRQPLEHVDLALFDRLRSGDVLFFDGSHRVFMNSDVVVFFLDVLPRLPPGVWVQIHDIFLPSDYPAEWIGRFYSEQYMLAVALLVHTDKFEVILPNYFISLHPELSQIMQPLWSAPELEGADQHGVSFWLRTK